MITPGPVTDRSRESQAYRYDGPRLAGAVAHLRTRARLLAGCAGLLLVGLVGLAVTTRLGPPAALRLTGSAGVLVVATGAFGWRLWRRAGRWSGQADVTLQVNEQAVLLQVGTASGPVIPLESLRPGGPWVLLATGPADPLEIDLTLLDRPLDFLQDVAVRVRPDLADHGDRGLVLPGSWPGFRHVYEVMPWIGLTLRVILVVALAMTIVAPPLGLLMAVLGVVGVGLVWPGNRGVTARLQTVTMTRRQVRFRRGPHAEVAVDFKDVPSDPECGLPQWPQALSADLVLISREAIWTFWIGALIGWHRARRCPEDPPP